MFGKEAEWRWLVVPCCKNVTTISPQARREFEILQVCLRDVSLSKEARQGNISERFPVYGDVVGASSYIKSGCCPPDGRLRGGKHLPSNSINPLYSDGSSGCVRWGT